MWNDFSARYADIMQNTRVSEWVDSMSSSLISWANDFAASSAPGIVEFGAGLDDLDAVLVGAQGQQGPDRHRQDARALLAGLVDGDGKDEKDHR